jgi:hypothetical protein
MTRRVKCGQAAISCCCVVLLALLQVSCDERPAVPADAATDGISQDRDSSIPGDSVPSADQPPHTDASSDLFIALMIETLYANCMPAVPPDPVKLEGHVEALNNGSSAVGPLSFTAGTLTANDGAELATFSVEPVLSHVIKPGEGLSEQIVKVPGSLELASGSACGLCGETVRVGLSYSGAGIPGGARVTSPRLTLSCAY